MIVRTLACALLLLDDFTGRPIDGSGALFAGAGRFVSPVRRQDGYYLFMKGSEEAPELCVSLPGYLESRFRAESTSGQDRLLRLRLCRASTGGYEDCDWLAGTGPPNAELLAVSKADGHHSFRLTAGEQGGEQALAVSGYIARQLSGLRYAAEDPGGELVDFTLEEKLASGSYRVTGLPDGRLESTLPLRRAYRSFSDGSGAYRIPINHGAEIQSVYVREGGRWVFCS